MRFLGFWYCEVDVFRFFLFKWNHDGTEILTCFSISLWWQEGGGNTHYEIVILKPFTREFVFRSKVFLVEIITLVFLFRTIYKSVYL